MIDAGQVPASPKRYAITYAHDHKTLCAGDIVVMAETRDYQNLLIRESDMTLHGLMGEGNQYVHMVEVVNTK